MICTKGYIGKWSKDAERQKWETDFSEKLINPIIENIEMELKNTYALAMKGIVNILYGYLTKNEYNA